MYLVNPGNRQLECVARVKRGFVDPIAYDPCDALKLPPRQILAGSRMDRNVYPFSINKKATRSAISWGESSVAKVGRMTSGAKPGAI